jgi:outer membrane protein TolC
MSRQFPPLRVLLVGLLTATLGCAPQQPFFFLEDGDLSHYVDKATEIEYPDVEACSLDEVTGAIAPLTLKNPDPSEIWELTLEEAIKIALENSKVVRSLSGGGTHAGAAFGPGPTPLLVDYLQRSPDIVTTVYSPALIESNPRFGVEAALAAFDAEFLTSVSWENNDRPLNTSFDFMGSQQDLGSFQAQLRKTAATGTTWSLTHNVDYEWNNSPIRRFPSDWNVNLDAELRHPLLQSGGVQFNRIAGPGSIPGFNNGVMIARVNTDISLTDFEGQIRNLVNDVERAYWTLYYAYRAVDAYSDARDQALDTWRKVRVEYETGTVAAHDEAQARYQYFDFRRNVEGALTELYSAENNLRLMIGLAATDGRLIRPADDPTTAKIDFDWCEAHGEALVRSVHIRRQKWLIKQRELELIAAKNYLLPRLDAVARYRWLGMGDHLIDPAGNPAALLPDPADFLNPADYDEAVQDALFQSRFDNAYTNLTDGDFQGWQLGLEFSMPIGFRRELAGVRHAQLGLARERTMLQEVELEVSHALSTALRDLEFQHTSAQTYHNQRVAAETELASWEAREKQGLPIREGSLDRKLDAQRRLVTAKVGYYAHLAWYNLAIAQVHFRKNSLLEYNGVYLAEGPWPQKAYFDALRRARARDASFYLDYGFTRPKVLSRGPVNQQAGQTELISDGEPTPAGDLFPEAIPAPAPEPLEILPDEPPQPVPSAAGVLNRGGLTSAVGQRGRRAPVKLSAAKTPVKAVGTSTPRGERAEYDLASLDLKVFDAEPSQAEPTRSASRSDVRPVSHQQVEPAPKGNGARTQRAEAEWTKADSSGVKSKAPASRPAPEADSGGLRWKAPTR